MLPVMYRKFVNAIEILHATRFGIGYEVHYDSVIKSKLANKHRSQPLYVNNSRNSQSASVTTPVHPPLHPVGELHAYYPILMTQSKKISDETLVVVRLIGSKHKVEFHVEYLLANANDINIKIHWLRHRNVYTARIIFRLVCGVVEPVDRFRHRY